MHYLENVLDKDNSFWKYIVVIIVTLITTWFTGGLFAMIVIVAYLLSKGGDFSPEMFANVKSLYDMGLPENLVLVLMLFPFAVGMLVSWALIRRMHKRTFSETVNGREKIRWNHVFSGFLFWFALMLVYLAISYIVTPNNFVLQFDSNKFITLLIIVLLFIPFQTTYEEYIFRGYLAQGVAAWTKNRWLVICIPGLLFGLMHYANTEVAEHGFWVAMPQYIISGLLFGLIAVLDDGIELPIGIHAANNLFACLFVTNKTLTLQTPAIFEQITIYPLADNIGVLITATLTVLFFYKRYKWNFNILNKKIKNKEVEEIKYY
jgi:membrane protease YdiL (CAAX protease family)